MAEQAFDKSEFEDLKQIALEAFWDLGSSVLHLVEEGESTEHDTEFGHALSDGTTKTALPYSQLLSSQLKALDPSATDFVAIQRHRVYIPTAAVEKKVRGGKILRERHLVLLNGVYYQIQAIVAFPQQHGSSIVYKLHLTERHPQEQQQGQYGA